MALMSKELFDIIEEIKASIASLEERLALLEEALAPCCVEGEDDGKADDQEEEASQES